MPTRIIFLGMSKFNKCIEQIHTSLNNTRKHVSNIKSKLNLISFVAIMYFGYCYCIFHSMICAKLWVT